MTIKEKKVPNINAPQKVRVVIADDEPIMIMNLTEILESNGYEVAGTAGDSFEAIDICRKQRPDVVLLDIQMPQLDGLSAAKYIYEGNLAETIIIVSAFDEEDFIQKAGNYGAIGYLVKPVDSKRLLPMLKVAIARSKELHGLRDEIHKATQDMESRKKIERAKGFLMEGRDMSEQEAYDYIRTVSKKYSMAMEMIANIILCGSDEQ